MAFKDREQRRAYHREYKRLRRAGLNQTPGQTLLPLPFRVKAAQDVLALIEEQINAVRAEHAAGTLEKARTVGYLAAIALRAVEAAELSSRVEAIETILAGRSVG